MLTVICPYCEIGVAVPFDMLLHDLISNKETTCKCTECNHDFIVFCEKNGFFKTKYDNSTFIPLEYRAEKRRNDNIEKNESNSLC